MLVGRIAKAEGTWWYAECDIIGAYTQGRSRKDAALMLADCIEAKIGREGLKVNVADAPGDESLVIVDASEPALLAAEVLKYQREAHGLSLADVAKRLGSSSRNAYAAYEQGKREPSIAKYQELLAAVAPELALTVGPRLGPLKAEPKAKAKTKRAAR
jgi:DNA-binding XRE family transcriptional regulator